METFKFLSSIINFFPKNCKSPLKDPVEVSKSFSDFFCFVAGRLDADIPRTEIDPMTYMPDALPDVFVPNPATPD